jgi:hypothetical protein
MKEAALPLPIKVRQRDDTTSIRGGLKLRRKDKRRSLDFQNEAACCLRNETGEAEARESLGGRRK